MPTSTAFGFSSVEVSTHKSEWHRLPLFNVTARACKTEALPRQTLIEIADRLLEQSLVDPAESATLAVWRAQLRAFLDGSHALPTNAHQPLSSGGSRETPLQTFLRKRLLHLHDEPPIAAIHGFNQTDRDRWVAAKAAQVPAGARLLDVGAGACPYRPLFAHTDYKTQDFKAYEGYIDAARNEGQYGAIDYVSDILAIPVETASFDAILCTEVLEHVPEPIGAVGEMARILKPGGTMILTAPLGSGLHQEPFHFYGGYTPHWYRYVAQRFGLEVLEITPNGGFYKHLAQECARVTWLMQGRNEIHGENSEAVGLLFGELLPRYLDGLDNSFSIPEFTVGYHAVLRKPD